MKTNIMTGLIVAIALGVFLIASPSGHAETGVADDDTITVLDFDETPRDFDRRITLPPHVPERAVERSQYGLDTANQARESNQEFGLERAREAREGNLGEQIRDRVRQSDRPERPDRPEPPVVTGKPELPERPEISERPERPELPVTGNPGLGNPLKHDR